MSRKDPISVTVSRSDNSAGELALLAVGVRDLVRDSLAIKLTLSLS